MRILIIEEALRGSRGHWPSYIGDIAAGLRELGDEVDVLLHAEADESVVQRVGGVRGLSRSCWEDPRSRGAAGGLVHNFVFHRDLSRFLQDRAPYDWILALTMRAQHILAFGALARRLRRERRTRFMLLFVQGQGRYAGPDRPSTFRHGMSSRLMRFGLKRMRRNVAAGQVILATETAAMKDEYERFVDLPFRLFPHPVRFGSRASDLADAGGGLTFVCPGFARHEKGSDLLQQAILELLREEPELPVRFVLQWLEPFHLPDGTVASVSPELARHEKVQVIDRVIDSVAYMELMERAHVVVLPYRADSYYARVSRVAIEAAILSKPMIVTEGTWLDQMRRDHGAGVAFRNEDVGSLLQSIRQSISNYRELARVARTRAPEAARHYSVASFRETLLA